MENNQTQFLTDILAQIQSLKEQLEKLESTVSMYLGSAESGDVQGDDQADDVLDEDLPEAIGEVPVPDGSKAQQEEAPMPAVEEDLPEAAVQEEVTIHEEKAARGETTVHEEETPIISLSGASAEEDLPVFGIEVDDEIDVVPIGEAHAATGAVMDKMAEKESWRTDIPGSSVSDIRSAISLNDRILFINTLFHEDPIDFKDTLSALNAMPSFDEGVKFIRERHPEWNTESDVVYRFMMAVRRKLK